jgi:hypothetical protein
VGVSGGGGGRGRRDCGVVCRVWVWGQAGGGAFDGYSNFLTSHKSAGGSKTANPWGVSVLVSSTLGSCTVQSLCVTMTLSCRGWVWDLGEGADVEPEGSAAAVGAGGWRGL